MAGNAEDVFRKAKSEYQALQILQVLMLRETCGRFNDSILGRAWTNAACTEPQKGYDALLAPISNRTGGWRL